MKKDFTGETIPVQSSAQVINHYVVKGDGYPVQPGQDARSLSNEQRRAWMKHIETKHKRKESANAAGLGVGGELSLSRS